MNKSCMEINQQNPYYVHKIYCNALQIYAMQKTHTARQKKNLAF